jgi:hypothetical protein
MNERLETVARLPSALASALLASALLASALIACTTGDTARPSSDAPLLPLQAAASDGQGTGTEGTQATGSAGDAPPSRQPRDVVELFATRILPTCSLNGGVCHNANNYPDLRSVAAMEDVVNLPCGRNSAPDLPDACEPAGDRFVARGGIDVVVERVSFDARLVTATITTRSDVPASSLDFVEIWRGAPTRALAASTAGATFTGDGGRTITVDLTLADDEARTFFEPQLPLREDRIWPADVNGNGIAGATAGWREIVPGRPDRSYVVARLWDTDLVPELMPRQCRAWDDDATRALGCWIEGLRVDDHGAPLNFYEPIDYARCAFTLPRAGRCASGP